MKTNNQKEILEQKIIFLRSKQENDLLQLKAQYYSTIDRLKPINLIKSSFQDIVESPNLKSNLLAGAIGLGSTYVSKTFLNENSVNPVKRVLAKVLNFAINKWIKK